MGITAAIVVGATVVGTSVYNTIESSNARGNAEKSAAESRRQQQEQLRLAEDQMKQQQTQYEEQKTLQEKQRTAQVETDQGNASRDLALTRQRKQSMQGQSYRDTILTGPLGIPSTTANAPNTAKKTLLGV